MATGYRGYRGFSIQNRRLSFGYRELSGKKISRTLFFLFLHNFFLNKDRYKVESNVVVSSNALLTNVNM